MPEWKRVRVLLFPSDDGRYVAVMPFLRGCTTQGDSPEEALANARESIELMLEDATDDDLESLDLSWSPHVVVGEVEVTMPKRTVSSPVGAGNIR